jgi:glycosyltransferase involved in cell wall biosynthesis
MGKMEQQLVAQCDEVIAVSESLVERMTLQRRSAKLLTHGVDLEFWRTSSGTELEQDPVFQRLERPLAVFWGVVDQRMNTGWVQALANKLQNGTIVLVGPLDNPNEALLKTPRVVHLRSRPYEQLPDLARLADVLIMPYADLPVTRAMQPLKLKEYLATGKPVVVSELPATLPWKDCLDIAATSEQFSDLVADRLKTGMPATQAIARRCLKAESWEAKAKQFEAWVGCVPVESTEARIISPESCSVL